MKNLYFGILLNEKVRTNSKTSVKKFGTLANQFHQICDFILHSLTYQRQQVQKNWGAWDIILLAMIKIGCSISK